MEPTCWSAVRQAGLAAALIAFGMVMTGEAVDRLLGATWLAEDIGGGGVVDRVQSTVSIAAGGKVTGSGGCNRLFGTATIEGSAITFSAMGSTRMACPRAVMVQEGRFLGALMVTRTFRIEGPHLTFYDVAGAELVRFTQLR